MRKRLISLLCVLALCLGLLPVTALADGVTEPIPEGLQLSGTIVTDYTGTATELEIPEGVTEIDDRAFLSSNVQQVTLPSTLENIGEYAFAQSALTSITIPESVATIGAFAFTKTKSLIDATILGNPTLGNNVFSESGIKSIEMDKVTAISDQCFASSSLSSISMDSVESIGQSAFQFTNLTEFTVPDTVESIGPYFLDNIDDLNKLTISLATLQKPGIDTNAFANIGSTCEVVLTDVGTDITLLEDGLIVDGTTYDFGEDFRVATVQEPSDCTITNQTGADVKIVLGDETITVPNGNAKPVGGFASSDAYLEVLTVTTDSGALILEPSFANPTTQYTSNVGNETASVVVMAQPSNAAATVSINGQTADFSNSYTVDVELAVGENHITIVVTATDNTTKTYTVTVTRNEAVPKHITISTAEELMDFAAKVNGNEYGDTSDMTVELAADIDLTGQVWTSIGDTGTFYFEGVFDGNDHTISGLTPDAQSGLYLGLFGATANTTIRDVHVKGTIHNTTSVQNSAIGGIVGLAQYCEITGCTTEFTVTCEPGATLGMIVGGIVGEADYCHIENCESDTNLSGKAYGYWGGIAGAVVDTELVNCVNRGGITITEISRYLYAGGIAGAVQSGGVISQCRNLGDLSLPLATQPSLCMVGGICGQLMAGELSDCTNLGAVSAKANSVGGIVGEVKTSSQNTISSTVKSCLNYGEVLSSHTTGNTGGIAASVSDSYEHGVEIAACVSLGSVTGGSKVHAITGYGSDDITFRDNYYDSTIMSSGDISESVTKGSTGMAAAELHSQSFVNTINPKGGHFRLDESGRIEVIPLSYTLTVEGSYADVSGAGEHEEGAQVTIDAGSRPGYRFTGWTATSGTIANPTDSRTTFTMPDEAATVTASWAAVPDDPDPSYSIKLDVGDHGSVHTSHRTAEAGETVTLTVTSDEGYQLVSLTVTDKNGNEIKLTVEDNGKFTFTMPAGKVKVEAVFAEISDYATCDGGADCPLWAFTDVDVNAWYHDGVHFCLDNGMMAGYGNGIFGPDDALSRAQLCQILYNLEGQPATSGSSVFTDVADGAWYADAVTWAASQGIVGGYGNGLFGPEDNITREQLAAILYRYAQAKGYDVSVGEDTNILSYTDALEISEYAIPAMQWACGAGIMEGDAGYLTPQGDATRAQVATMLMRFCGYAE